jgi:hypothetical protein
MAHLVRLDLGVLVGEFTSVFLSQFVTFSFLVDSFNNILRWMMGAYYVERGFSSTQTCFLFFFHLSAGLWLN